ncbi:hypothetical protein SDJN02_25699, partial [Cucurbita argyrosperma subsp. argyrosperma]
MPMTRPGSENHRIYGSREIRSLPSSSTNWRPRNLVNIDPTVFPYTLATMYAWEMKIAFRLLEGSSGVFTLDGQKFIENMCS